MPVCASGHLPKNGNSYFIKQLMFPTYPIDDLKLSPTLVAAMRSEAEDFFSRRSRYYETLFSCKTGNIVTVQDFFRFKSHFFLVSEKMIGPYLRIDEITTLSDEKKKTLFKAILYSFVEVHNRGIVHSDLKPDNVLIKKTAAGYCTAKIIDFDSGFFEYECPEEIEGDQVYFSPEALMRNDEEDVAVTVKSDVFAIGLLFHLYWCGQLPEFDKSKNNSAGVALLRGEELKLDSSIPPEIGTLISDMLSKEPENRPTVREAWEYLAKLDGPPIEKKSASPTPPEEERIPQKRGGFYTPQEDDL